MHMYTYILSKVLKVADIAQSSAHARREATAASFSDLQPGKVRVSRG